MENNLTEREKQVIKLLASGLKNGEIGQKMHISGRTVEAHISALSKKFGAKNRTNLIYIATSKGFVSE